MPFTPERKRCKDCRKLFWTHRVGQLYCTEQCRRNFNNYGKTPTQQLIRRLNSFMRTPAWREMLEREVRAMLDRSGEDIASALKIVGHPSEPYLVWNPDEDRPELKQRAS